MKTFIPLTISVLPFIGKAYQASTGSWYCESEQAAIIITPTNSSSTIASTTAHIISSSSGHSITPIPIHRDGAKHRTPTGLIAGVSIAVGVVFILVACFLLWWRSTQNRRSASLGVAQPGPTTLPLALAPSSPQHLEEKDFSSGLPASYSAPTFTYLPEVQHDPNHAARILNYPSTALSTTPVSLAYACDPSSASTAPSSYGSPIPTSIITPNSMQYPSSANLDATEQHLLAARVEADRELAKMQSDGRC